MNKILHFFFILSIAHFSYAQLTVTTGSTPTTLVNALLGTGVTVSNVVFQGINGTGGKYQIGSFTAAGTVATNLGFSSGIVLCSGHVGDIPLAMATFPGNSNFTSSGFGSCTTGEVRQGGTCPTLINDVDILAGSVSYYNAAILEFDFVTAYSTVLFKYVFGSEEYDQNDGSGFPINYNCSSYNDKFGFIMSGPGIAGGQGFTNNGRNIARLSNGSVVSINSVNDGVVGSAGGSPSAANCLSDNPAWTNGSPTAEFNGPIYGIQFNGNTKVLTALQGGLTVGSTYHIKIIVTDVNDGAYDSGVFLQAASFTSPTTLPVELSALDVQCNTDYTSVNWQTESENNNAYSIVQRAYEDLVFEDIAVIQGNGKSNTPNHYVFNDVQNSIPCYYRLEQVDMDSSRTISKTVYAKNDCKTQFSFTNLYYNSTNEALRVHYSSSFTQAYQLEIYDVLGKLVYSNTIIGEAGNNIQNISVKDFSNGLYICSLLTPNARLNKKIWINSK